MDEPDKPTVDGRIDLAPEPIKALFREYDENDVVKALNAVGMSMPPQMLSGRQVEELAAEAELLLKAEYRTRMRNMLHNG